VKCVFITILSQGHLKVKVIVYRMIVRLSVTMSEICHKLSLLIQLPYDETTM